MAAPAACPCVRGVRTEFAETHWERVRVYVWADARGGGGRETCAVDELGASSQRAVQRAPGPAF